MEKKILTVSNKEIRDIDADLTFKQKAFLKKYLETGNGTRAALEVFDTDDVGSAASMASNLLRLLKNPIKVFLENKGLSIANLTKVLVEAMQAEKTDITGDKHPDHKTRMEAVDRLAKWLDVEPKESTVPEGLKKRIVAEEFFDLSD